MPIVVGYDHSNSATVALDWAGQLGESSGAPVMVVHASERIVYARDVSHGLLDPARERESAVRIAQEGAKRLNAQHPALEVEAVGSILGATVALDEASASASMIVVGSHGRGRVSSVMLGSTAYALSGHARCPVIVVREQDAPLPGTGRPVVVGSDGSLSAEHAVDSAADIAQRWQAPLIVVSSWAPPPPDPWENPPFGYPSVAAAIKARKEKATEANQDGVERVRSWYKHQDVEGLVVEARPEDAIMNASPNAAMLVMGSRGHTQFMGMLLGSTARAVLHQSSTPVMIVR
ncbi:MAG: universal stress protein [Ornithinimicrobium sp.]